MYIASIQGFHLTYNVQTNPSIDLEDLRIISGEYYANFSCGQIYIDPEIYYEYSITNQFCSDMDHSCLENVIQTWFFNETKANASTIKVFEGFEERLTTVSKIK